MPDSRIPGVVSQDEWVPDQDLKWLLYDYFIQTEQDESRWTDHCEGLADGVLFLLHQHGIDVPTEEPELCTRCGRPAQGFSAIGTDRLCHDDVKRPSCYELEQWDRTFGGGGGG